MVTKNEYIRELELTKKLYSEQRKEAKEQIRNLVREMIESGNYEIEVRCNGIHRGQYRSLQMKVNRNESALYLPAYKFECANCITGGLEVTIRGAIERNNELYRIEARGYYLLRNKKPDPYPELRIDSVNITPLSEPESGISYRGPIAMQSTIIFKIRKCSVAKDKERIIVKSKLAF